MFGGRGEEGREDCKRAQGWITDLGGDRYVHYLNCGEVIMGLTYSKNNQITHFKYVSYNV